MANDVEITSNTDAVRSAMSEAKEKALEIIGLTAESYAKMLCPVDTGRLRNSISHTADEEAAYIGTNVEYAPFVEYGHGGFDGAHYLQGAVQGHGEEYKQIMEQCMKEAE